MPKLKVLITGAGGNVGRCLTPPFQDLYELRTLDIRPVPGDPNALVTDLRDFEALKSALRGIDVLVHLAAYPNEAAFHDVILPHNIVGLYNAFQAAQEAGVRRIVFTSSCHSVMAYPLDRTVEIEDPVRPPDIYGAAKVFGEVLGRYYHEKFGMEFVALRLGWFLTYDDERVKSQSLARACWLSPRDAVRLFRRAIEKPEVKYAVVFGTSIPAREWLSRKSARELLDYEPEESWREFFGGASS